jgi:hypothetical protein
MPANKRLRGSSQTKPAVTATFLTPLALQAAAASSAYSMKMTGSL